MPRIFGLNAVGVLVSAIVFYMIGYLIYGVLFMELWAGEMGIEIDPDHGPDPIELIKGFMISLVSATFIGLALKKMGASDMMSGLKKAAFLWLGFAMTTLAYGWVYGGYSSILYMLDGAHLLIGFLVVAAIQNMMDGMGSKPVAD
jgi:hypothetical protein